MATLLTKPSTGSTGYDYAERSAFTLVESLVVIVIVAALAAILLPVAFRQREMSRRSVCANNLKQLVQAVHLYESDWGMLPVDSGRLTPGILDGKLDPYGVALDLTVCPADVGPPSPLLTPTYDGRLYWYGTTSYAYVLLEGLLAENHVSGRHPLAPSSPLFLCPNHARAWHMQIIGFYDGSARVEPLGKTPFVPEFENIGKVWPKV